MTLQTTIFYKKRPRLFILKGINKLLKKRFPIMSVLLSLCLVTLLTGCANTHKEYIQIPQVSIPDYLFNDCLPPIIPSELTWGESLLLNQTLLTVIELCNLDKKALKLIEQQRQTLSNIQLPNKK